MKPITFVLLLLSILLGTVFPGFAAEAPTLDTQVSRVALFKNGLGFFVREGRLPSARVFTVGPFAAPSHGTFWLSYPQEVGLENLVAREVTSSKAQPALTLKELLQANVGREMIINWGMKDIAPLQGKLISLGEEPEPPKPDPYGWPTPIPSPASPRVALLETSEGLVGFDPNGISRVTILGENPASSLAKKTKAWELEARLKRAAPGAAVTASYLAKGITWAPSYIIDISNPKEARLTAKAEIINEAEDLAGVNIDLITGFPNLQYADIVSPLVGKQRLADFLSALARGTSGSGTRSGTSMVMAQAAYEDRAYRRGAEFENVMPEYGAAAAGKSLEDLFLYRLDKVNLKKGETGYFPLFTAAVPYTQIYKWDIPDYINQEDIYGNPRRQGPETQEEVWHSIRLTNTGKLPWTTAPAETVKDNQIIGQDTLLYTPSTGETLLRITRAMSVKAEQAEWETNRQRQAVELYGRYYDRVTLEGRLRVVNYKSEAVNMEVTKTISGEIKSSAPQAKVETLARGLARMNPVNTLTWEFELKPGATKELTYTYEALIRR